MTEKELLNKIWKWYGSAAYPENEMIYKLTRSGAKRVSAVMALSGEFVDPAVLRDCFWSFSDATWYGVQNFRLADLWDYRDVVRHRKDGWWIKHPAQLGEWIFLGD